MALIITSSPRRTTIAMTVLLLLGVVGDGFKMEFDNWSLPTYDKTSYRQHPYHRVGIFGPKSSATILAGKKGELATIEVDLKMSNSPHGVFQVYIYHSEFVEGTILPSLQEGNTSAEVIHPCMNYGQSSGVFILSNMSSDAYTIDSNHLAVRSVENTDTYIQGKIFLKNTGLYIVSINACRWQTSSTVVAGPHNTTRLLSTTTLDTSGWHSAKVHGSISVRNPYGYLLGQEFGYMPAYASCLITSATLLIVYFVQCVRCGLKTLLKYQQVLLVLALSSTISYLLLSAFFFTINIKNEQNHSFFVAASVGLLMRSTFSRCVMYLLCTGWNVLRPTLPYEKWLFLGFFAAFHLGLSLTFFVLNHLHDRGTGGFDVADQPELAVASVNLVTVLIEIGLVIATGWELRSTKQALYRMQVPVKTTLYKRTTYVLVGYITCSVVWLTFINIPGNPVSTAESSWQMWWLRGSVWELNYLWCYCVMLVLWMPGRLANRYLALERGEDQSDRENSGPPPQVSVTVRGEEEEEEVSRVASATFRAPRRKADSEFLQGENAEHRVSPALAVDYEVEGGAVHPGAYESHQLRVSGQLTSTAEHEDKSGGSQEMSELSPEKDESQE